MNFTNTILQFIAEAEKELPKEDFLLSRGMGFLMQFDKWPQGAKNRFWKGLTEQRDALIKKKIKAFSKKHSQTVAPTVRMTGRPLAQINVDVEALSFRMNTMRLSSGRLDTEAAEDKENIGPSVSALPLPDYAMADTDKEGNTAIHILMQQGYIESAKKLFQTQDINPLMYNEKGDSYFSLALKNNQPELFVKIWDKLDKEFTLNKKLPKKVSNKVLAQVLKQFDNLDLDTDTFLDFYVVVVGCFCHMPFGREFGLLDQMRKSKDGAQQLNDAYERLSGIFEKLTQYNNKLDMLIQDSEQYIENNKTQAAREMIAAVREWQLENNDTSVDDTQEIAQLNAVIAKQFNDIVIPTFGDSGVRVVNIEHIKAQCIREAMQAVKQDKVSLSRFEAIYARNIDIAILKMNYDEIAQLYDVFMQDTPNVLKSINYTHSNESQLKKLFSRMKKARDYSDSVFGNILSRLQDDFAKNDADAVVKKVTKDLDSLQDECDRLMEGYPYLISTNLDEEQVQALEGQPPAKVKEELQKLLEKRQERVHLLLSQDLGRVRDFYHHVSDKPVQKSADTKGVARRMRMI